MAKFEKGRSGNPGGRPKGVADRRTELRSLMAPHAPELVRRCVEMALAGDPTSMRICMDRLIPPLREEPLKAKVPPINGPDDCLTAQAAVIAAVAAGDMLPSEAQLLTGLIEAQRRTYETTDLAKRLASLEAQLTPKESRP